MTCKCCWDLKPKHELKSEDDLKRFLDEVEPLKEFYEYQRGFLGNCIPASSINFSLCLMTMLLQGYYQGLRDVKDATGWA